MQAVSIPNVSSTAAPVPAAALPANAAPATNPTGQQSSPFTSLFQSALKGSGDGKLPFAGKPKDSARAKDVLTTIPSNIPQFAVTLPGPAFSPVVPAAQTPDAAKSIANPKDGTFAELNFGSEPVQPSLSAFSQAADAGKSITVPNEGASSDATVGSESAKPSISANLPAAPSIFQAPLVAISRILSEAVGAQEDSNLNSNFNTNPTPNPNSSDSLPSNPIEAQVSSGSDSNPGVSGSQFGPENPSAQTDVQAIAIAPQAIEDPPFANLATGDWNAKAVPNPGPGVDVLSSAPQQAKTNGAAPVLPAKIRDLQAAHTALDLPSVQFGKPPQPSGQPSPQSPQPSIPAVLPQFDLKLQPAGKNTAPVISVPTSHETVPLPPLNNSQSAPVGVVPITPQSKDTSSGLQGNDTNGKADHSSKSPVDPANAKGFVQSLEIAGQGGGSAPPAATNSPTAIAPQQVPANTGAAIVDGKPGAGSGATLLQGASMPAASGESRPTVSAAHLTDHAGQTEIRIEMQADSLGGVELRAHITGDQIGASISAEHHETQLLLANELPSLHSALAEKNLRIDSLTVSQGMPSSMGGGLGSGAEHRWFSQSNQQPAYSIQNEVPLPSEDIAAQSTSQGNLSGRLSVLA